MISMHNFFGALTADAMIAVLLARAIRALQGRPQLKFLCAVAYPEAVILEVTLLVIGWALHVAR